MAGRTGMSGNSTAAVLWLMILLVFLPITVAHVLARQVVEPPQQSGAAQHREMPRAG